MLKNYVFNLLSLSVIAVASLAKMHTQKQKQNKVTVPF